jgi:DNA-binding MarR family transcriptional regulator
VETDLLTGQRLSLPAYTMLARLADTLRRRLRMRMRELAEVVMLSRSGLTRLVDRLEHDGLVIRARVRDDGRGVAVFLTDRGLRRQRQAFSTYQQAVARHFAHGLTGTDLATLRQIS